MKKIMSLDEVRALLPRLIEQTEHTIRTMSKGKKILDNVLLPENEQESIETDMVELFSLWVSWVRLHGGKVKGPWLIDFDNGHGYFCWRYGEKDIMYEHEYDNGFENRQPIDERRYTHPENEPEAEPDSDYPLD